MSMSAHSLNPDYCDDCDSGSVIKTNLGMLAIGGGGGGSINIPFLNKFVFVMMVMTMMMMTMTMTMMMTTTMMMMIMMVMMMMMMTWGVEGGEGPHSSAGSVAASPSLTI